MNNRQDIDKSCDFSYCNSQAYRHFWMHHFCNEHNWYLRKKAQRKKVEDLEKFVKKHTEV